MRRGHRVLFVAAALALCWVSLAATSARGEEVRVAAAANFRVAAEALITAFERRSGHDVILSTGGTGALYAQISQGAPFDVLLAADTERPARAVSEGLGVAGSIVTYARGRLVLYSPDLDLSDGAAVLRQGNFDHLAIADPRTAPYGAAAQAALEALGVAQQLEAKLVIGESVAQALLFVESGNAELGLVALGQVHDRPESRHWLVPSELHPPIRQDAVLLATGQRSAAARAFLDFLTSSEGQQIVVAHGYAMAGGDDG